MNFRNEIINRERGVHVLAREGESNMTDYQFKTVLKMVRDIVNRSDDIEEIRKSLNELIDGEHTPDKAEG